MIDLEKLDFLEYIVKHPNKSEKLLNMYKHGLSMKEIMIRQTGRTSRELLDVIHSASVLYNNEPNEKVYYICHNEFYSSHMRRTISNTITAMGCDCISDMIVVTTKKEYINEKKYVIQSHSIKEGI